MSYPVPLSERVEQSVGIVLGKVVAQHCFFADNGYVNTLNTVEVLAWLKGNTGQKTIGLITHGGVLGQRATVVHPSLQLEKNTECILFLEGNNIVSEDKALRESDPALLQTFAYAYGQGALKLQDGLYFDLLAEPPHSEAFIFKKIVKLTGEQALTPEGEKFLPRFFEPTEEKLLAITSFSPNPTPGGTVETADFLTITGSGFGATQGTSVVSFKNADDGGTTNITPPVTSDYVSWSDTEIKVKVPTRAGTGKINVTGSGNSSTDLTVNYAHSSINHDYLNFGTSTRQRFYLRDFVGGGMEFKYNTTSGFSTNGAAKNAFTRALNSWRCGVFVNFTPNGNTGNGMSGSDGVNVVMFDPSLSSGILGQAVSNYSGQGVPTTCEMANTCWWLEDIDIRFRNPPTGTTTWNFTTSAPASNQYDFESVAVHELGHAIGLAHRIASGQVMHYAIANGTMTRTPSSEEIAGGVAKMAYSTVNNCLDTNFPSDFDDGAPMTPLDGGNCTLALPVELVSFSAQTLKNQVLLHWRTASELDNDRFEIERSTDGRDFEKIGSVPGNGTVSAILNYQFLDENPPASLVYYRLRQVDFDGSFEYSPIVSAKIDLGKDFFRAYPNPTTRTLFLEAADGRAFSLSNSFGKEILRLVQQGEKMEIDLRGLPAGFYFLTDEISKKQVKIAVLAGN